MSGTDAKTGTSDYLTNFLNLKSITEDLDRLIVRIIAKRLLKIVFFSFMNPQKMLY